MKPAKVQLEEALAEAHGLVDGLTDERMNYRTAAGIWSAGENLDHLTITARRMMKAMDAAVDSLRDEGRRFAGPYQPGLIGRWFLWVLEPPVRKGKFKAPAEFHGQPDRPAHLVRGEFYTAHEELRHRLGEYGSWDQKERRVVSPFDSRGKLRYSIGLSLLIIPTHMRRHLWQARNTLNEYA